MEHPNLRHIIVPNSPLRYKDTVPIALTVGFPLGTHNKNIYVDFLGLPEAPLDELRDQSVI